MRAGNTHYKTIWMDETDEGIIRFIDQCLLPHRFSVVGVTSVSEMEHAIRTMQVRGAGLLGAAAGYGMYLAAREACAAADFDQHIRAAAEKLKATRPTAVNLETAVLRQLESIFQCEGSPEKKVVQAKATARAISDEDELHCRSIGQHGYSLLEVLSKQKGGKTINILTHCNAGWLAFVDNGTATAPIYEAFRKGIDLHVWVDETRPRNQGASLTAWELLQEGIPHTVIPDNTGGHLMQNGLVDIVLTGADRVTRNGDAANKIGTYLKALAAADNHIPFYVCLPSTTFDWNMQNGTKEIPIESRNTDEVKYVSGLLDGKIVSVLVTPPESPAANFGFDVTPARLITGFITERGICQADEASILELFPEQKR